MGLGLGARPLTTPALHPGLSKQSPRPLQSLVGYQPRPPPKGRTGSPKEEETAEPYF